MDPEIVDTGMRHVAWFIGLLISLAALWKIYHEWDKRRVAAAAAEIEACRQAQEDRELLKKIQKELHPNDGSSMRDAVNRLEASISALSNDHKDLHRRTDWIYRHMFEFEGRESREEEA